VAQAIIKLGNSSRSNSTEMFTTTGAFGVVLIEASFSSRFTIELKLNRETVIENICRIFILNRAFSLKIRLMIRTPRPG
jgi:hypothetical protein